MVTIEDAARKLLDCLHPGVVLTIGGVEIDHTELNTARGALGKALEPSDAVPLFYVKRNKIYQRPVRRPNGAVSLGFDVCTVSSGVSADEVCKIMNRGEAPPADEPAEE